MKPTVSIVICCYNSSQRIPRVLEHLSKLNTTHCDIIELIVVDNNSSDDTAKVAVNLWRDLGSPFPISSVFESRQGLAFARKAGINEARGQYTLFCDDDNYLKADYADIASHFLDHHPCCGILGGVSVPVFESEPPSWFFSYCDKFAVGNPAIASRDVTTSKYVWGAGMFLRTLILKQIYCVVSPLVSGRSGKALSSGDDGEICAWFIMCGYTLYVESNCFFYHLMTSQRLTVDYFNNFLASNTYSAWSAYSSFLTLIRFLIPMKYSKGYLLPCLYYAASIYKLIAHPRDFYSVARIYLHLRLKLPNSFPNK